MMKEFFLEWNPNTKSKNLVLDVAAIIQRYSDMGYKLTLRQIYYQMVKDNIIENTERSYKNLGNLITKARNAGLLSWQAIEDRNRTHHSFWTEEDITVPIRQLPNFIRFDQWERQEWYVEVWVEKEALGNVIERACRDLLVPHMACKGYLSASEAWRAGKRFEQKIEDGKKCKIIHLGDHDPSGIDMTRDNQDRIDMYSNSYWDGQVEVDRIALSMDQIDQYAPPPNPAKLTDSRSKEYVKKYGRESWELDALDAPVIEDLIQDAINPLIDWDMWEETQEEEREAEKELEAIGDNWGKIQKFIKGMEKDNE